MHIYRINRILAVNFLIEYCVWSVKFVSNASDLPHKKKQPYRIHLWTKPKMKKNEAALIFFYAYQYKYKERNSHYSRWLNRLEFSKLTSPHSPRSMNQRALPISLVKKWLYIFNQWLGNVKNSRKNIGFLLYPSGNLRFRLATSYLRFDTIFGVQWLNCCVRDGNRCDPLAIITILSHGPFKNKHQLRHNCGYSYSLTLHCDDESFLISFLLEEVDQSSVWIHDSYCFNPSSISLS